MEGLRAVIRNTLQPGEGWLLWTNARIFSVRDCTLDGLNLISLFGIEVLFRTWFQEYEGVAILNIKLISLVALLYSSGYFPVPLFRYKVGLFKKSLIKGTTE